MKATKDNFQFQHDGTEEADKAMKLISRKFIGTNKWYGKCGDIVLNHDNPKDDIPVISIQQAIALMLHGEQPFDRNNFCVDIQKEKDSPLLPKFKEWIGKYIYDETYRYYGKERGNKFGSVENGRTNLPVYTLSELQKHMPEIWANEPTSSEKGKRII